jgi:superfamily I DNA and RNA helicase
MNGNPDFWRNVLEQVLEQDVPDDWNFDTLIVDEGQDFESEWLEILRLFLHKGANVLWLEDSDQNIYSKTPVPLHDFVRYRCAVNYRSPESIAAFIARTLSIPFEQGNHLPGLGVGVHGYDEADEQPKIVGKIVQDLMRQGFSHDDIAVVSCRACRVRYSVMWTRSVAWICGISPANITAMATSSGLRAG